MPAGLDDAGLYRETPEGRQRRAESIERTFQIDRQGRFRIDDLEYGRYQLVAIFFRTLPREANAQPDVAGLAAKDFELTDGAGDFDLGILPGSSPGDTR